MYVSDKFGSLGSVCRLKELECDVLPYVVWPFLASSPLVTCHC